MSRIFLDANMLLDNILDREPFAEYAERLLSINGFEKFIAALNISNIYYITQRESDKHEARKSIASVIEHCQILDVNESILRRYFQSLFSVFSDFEDAIQHYCAVAH